MHMTHTGEQGYVLYIPNEFAVEIYDSIMEAGLILNIKCGSSLGTIHKRRLPKGGGRGGTKNAQKGDVY